VAALANQLLDSNLVDQGSLQPYVRHLLSMANKTYETLQEDKSADIWYYDESIHLLGRLNNTAGNEVLQKILMLNNKDLNHFIITDLLQNRQTVSSEIIEAQAADKEWRYILYETLHTKKLTSFFPQRWANQKSMAESEVSRIATDDGSELEGIVYLREKVINFKGEQRRFHFFKIKTGELWYLAVAGPFSMNEQELLMKDTDNTGGIYWDEVYNAKEVEKQMEQLLKMIEE
jgi:hypothetical protein